MEETNNNNLSRMVEELMESYLMKLDLY